MKIRTGVMGVGRWGEHYVRNLLQHPDLELTAIVDSSEERLNRCREAFKLDPGRVKLTTDWRDIEADALVVATPATTHYSLITSALNAGYHVLAEKPLTLNPVECEELTALARERGLILFTDHTYLFHNSVIAGKQVIENDRLGQLRYGYSARTHQGPVRHDVDALWDLAVHDIAIFNHWLGETPTRVQARGNSWLQPHLSDLVWLTLTYPSGFAAQIHLCWSNPDKQRRLAVAGSEGTLIFDELHPQNTLTLQRGTFSREGRLLEPVNQSVEVIPVQKNEPLKTVCDRFFDSIISKNTPGEASGRAATELVRIIYYSSQSLERGGEEIDIPFS